MEKDQKVGQKLPNWAKFRKLAKLSLVRKLPIIPQTPEQLADRTWYCPKCNKTLGQLRAKGKIIIVQGYQQCADCHADIDCALEKPRVLKKIDWLVLTP